MYTYYTEYPTSRFTASNADEALGMTSAEVVFVESNTFDGKPYVILRNWRGVTGLKDVRNG